MNTKDKYNETDFLNVAIDCFAYIFLMIFWFIAFIIPLILLIAYLYRNLSIDSYFIIIWVLMPLLFSLPFFILSRGMIYRKRVIMLIASAISFLLLYYNIKKIINIDKTNTVKFITTIEGSMFLMILGSILIAGLFIKRINTKK